MLVTHCRSDSTFIGMNRGREGKERKLSQAVVADPNSNRPGSEAEQGVDYKKTTMGGNVVTGEEARTRERTEGG